VVNKSALDMSHVKAHSVLWQTITATPRQLESLIRISEALARMRLSDTVEEADAAEALRLMQVHHVTTLGMTHQSAGSRPYRALLSCDSHLLHVLILRTCQSYSTFVHE
jgi:hypothetical protein